MANLFLSPRKILSGKEALETSGLYLKELGSKALIITDNIMVSTGKVQKVTKVLEENAIQYKLWPGINSEPTDEMVYQGIELYSEAGCDFLIALGGGSPIDAMKAIGALITNKGSLTDYMGKELKKTIPNLVAIPTTAGTGSEATQFTIITDTKNNVKMLLKGAVLMPSLAIVDPGLTITSPATVTAATGIDALTHAVEAYSSRKAQPLSDVFAMSACKRIFGNLRQAYINGSDLEARNQMALAALEAGIAFNNSSVTIVHGMSRPIGALFHVTHGVSNAMLLGACLKFAVEGEGTEARFADIAKTIGIFKEGMTAKDASWELIKEIDKLCSDLHIPTLKDYGVARDEFFNNIDKMADDALISGSPDNTRRKPNKDEITEIYKSLWI
ncbi:iron-containing alcohol dehydrogenase [Acetobacterium sp.]|uniref:iron-containing alcohol dehydrogenase n=1 Tax=Acetobacterium sp. TaxID=1872094 RepID=UPI002F42F50A